MLITFKGGLQPMRAYYTILFTSMYLKKCNKKKKNFITLFAKVKSNFPVQSSKKL